MASITFDLNGTLLDPGEQADVLQDGVRLAMAHTLADDFRPFAELLEAAGGEVPESMPPFGAVVAGLEEASAYEPYPRAYALIESEWHVAAHWWDVLGAGAVGRKTVYVARQEPLPPTVRADVVVERLDELELPA